MVHELIKKGDSIIRRFRDDLLEFAELRNAIVHSKRKDEIIAYPTETAVKEILKIKNELVNPPILKSLFGKQVKTVNIYDTLSSTLALMRELDISQIPVLDGKAVVEVINGNTISRWLSHHEIISTHETKIQDIFPFIEKKKNFRFLSEKTDVYTCAETYSDSLCKGWYFDAILITNSGRNGEGLTGIVVLEDIAKYLN